MTINTCSAARDPRTHRVHQSMTVRDSILDEDPPSRPFRYGDLRSRLPVKDSVFARATFTPLTPTSAKIAPVESNTIEAFFELAPLPVR